MAYSRQTERVLAAIEPNMYHLRNPPAKQPPVTQKPSVQPSPLKKGSDYAIVQELRDGGARVKVAPPRPRAAPRVQALKKATNTPEKKTRKEKILCATPPVRLQTKKGLTYQRGIQLGEGGFARCFLVQNKEGVYYAAKTVAKKSLANPKMMQKFMGEIQVHKTMVHPNIVRFIECFEDVDNIYIILELCPNKSLMEMLRRRRRFTEPETRYFILQLLGALKYMHGKNVIHRDLKLANIFLDAKMNIKIGDFGLAALLVNEDDKKKTICGTPNYIAPEVLFGGGKAGEGHSFGVDLWGVGVIMYAMLVGKPPFQSADVESTYKKIRKNEFDWPESITVSHSAKSLVSSLLNKEPTARPSLDEIANHSFFRTGHFPRALDKSSLQAEPRWPSLSTQSYESVGAWRAEWKRNYDHVAKECGVGIDAEGKPIQSVGMEAGKPMRVIPFPESRPPSSSSSENNNCVNVDKLIEKKQKERLQSKVGSGAYMLPEALSPRDGHARMRNMDKFQVNKVSNRLMALRQAARVEPPPPPPQEENIEEITEDESEEEPEAIPQLARKPIRRSSAEGDQKTTTMTTATRRVTRSHAALQREANRPVLPPPSEKPAEERAQTTVPTKASAPASVAALEERPNSASSSGSSRPAGYISPMHIPLGSSYASRIGDPISHGSTSAILSSIRPIVTNLTAFTSGKISSLGPQPPETVTAVDGYKSGQRNTGLFITKWVDYTNKYGMAYILSDGTCGALFNDNTSIVVNSVNGQNIEWVTQSLVPEALPAKGVKETVFRRSQMDMSVFQEKSKKSRGLYSKLAVWKRTGNYMRTTLGSAENYDVKKEDVKREPSIAGAGNPDEMVFVTHYARLRRCVAFRFIDGNLQFNFSDHTKIVLSSCGRTVRLFMKDHSLHVISLEDADRLYQRKKPAIIEFGLKQKLVYIQELLRAWLAKGRFPRDTSNNGEKEGAVVVLGDGPPVDEV